MKLIELGRKTTAAKTAFCSEAITHAGRTLYVDGNQKITAGNGTFDDPKPNAFSLVQIEDCPGSTPTCRSTCYVHGLEANAKTTHDLYRHNSVAIREILALPTDEALEWARVFAEWIKANAAGGFRWHVSGDLITAQYAVWISAVCEYAPNVDFWIYTRSFDFVWPMTTVPNLAVNLSCDVDNLSTARLHRQIHAPFKDLRLCYLTVDGTVPRLPEGSVIFPDYSLRGTGEGSWFEGLPPEHKRMVCPVDTFGKSEAHRCGVCRKCF